MSKSRSFEDYTITAILMEESNSIFVQFYNTIRHTKYENTIPYDSFGLPGKVSEVFQVVNFCFDKKEDYTFGFAINGSRMGVMFDAKLGGFLTVSFNIVLDETAVCEDSKVSFKLNELEAKLAETKAELVQTSTELFQARMLIEENTESIRSLETKLKAQDGMISIIMNSCEVSFQRYAQDATNMYTNAHSYPEVYSTMKGYPLNTEEITFSYTCCGSALVDWTKLKLLPNLTKLTVGGYACSGFQLNASSLSLEHLIIQSDTGNHLDITPFEWLFHFPNLHTIDAKSHLSMMVNILGVLPEYPNIKHIKIHTTTPALVRYCLANNITLE
jgi:molybdopterin converting factor small subunit